MMAMHNDLQYGTYRCPVCGHRDATELQSERPNRVVDCSYCDTPLEVSARGPESVRFSVQVAEAPARG
jgi:transcription elongation factor Elf1